MFRENERLEQLRAGSCMFNPAKACSRCFQCIGLINQKKPEELDVYEAARLLEYKMYQLNIKDFEEKLNRNYRKKTAVSRKISLSITCSRQLFQVKAETCLEEQGRVCPIQYLSNGMKSLYMLSLLETYTDDEARIPSIIIVEDPETVPSSAAAENGRPDPLSAV